MARIVVFAEPGLRMSVTLVAAVLDAAAGRGDLEIVAVCDAGRRPVPRGAAARDIAAALTKRTFDPCHPIALFPPAWRSLRSTARAAGVPLVVPPGRNVNHPDFRRILAEELGADHALSLVCLQIFARELLAVFRGAVNFHNGRLPGYRGLRATAWSVYHGERTSGFSFHHMTAGIDEGNVVVEGEVPVGASRSSTEIELDKTLAATRALGRVLDALVSGEPGRPQVGESRYFSVRDTARIRLVEDPSALTWDELCRRIRAFDLIEIPIAGRLHPVTKLRRVEPEEAPRPRELRTRDGVRAEPRLFLHLPWPLYAIYRAAVPDRGRSL